MSSLMHKLLGHTSEIDTQYRKCREQIDSLLKRIKTKVEEKDDEVLTKFNERHNKLLQYETEYEEKKHQSSKPDHTPHIPVNQRPSKQISRLNAGFRLQKTMKGHSDKIYALQWSADSQNLISASQDGSLVVWDMSDKNYKKKIGIPLRMAWVMTVAYSPDGEFVASGGLDNLCSVFDIKDKLGWASATGATPHRELQQHEGYVSCARFVDGNHILTASGDSTCIYWDIEYQQPIQCFVGHGGDVDAVAHNKVKQNIFVSGSIDCTAKIWDYRMYKAVNTFQGHLSDVNSVQWFPDGNAFGTGSDDGCCRLLDMKSYQTINIYGNKMKESYGVTSIDFSKSGYYLCAAYDDGPMCLSWNTVTAKEEKLLEHQARVSSLEFAPNGTALATGCWDKSLRIFV